MAMLANEPVLIHGNGTQSRDFTYVKNVVEANLLACEAPDAAGKVFNISGGERHSLLDLTHALEALLHHTVKICFSNARPGDVKHSQADITRAKCFLAYEPLVNFHKGLAATVQWYQETFTKAFVAKGLQ
jgi:UDP-N-acetylglucosamine/UDP-N-acetylgalactosamine 4-epimerase